MVIYLLHYQLLPEDRLAELMADLFGIRLVAATTVANDAIGNSSRTPFVVIVKVDSEAI